MDQGRQGCDQLDAAVVPDVRGQMAEVAILRQMFQEILRLIAARAALRSLSPKLSIASRATRRIWLITLSEGEIGELHVGLKGTMNALFLKDLAQKTRRGLEGRIRQGKSGGGRCFGYDIVQVSIIPASPSTANAASIRLRPR
jgi:hypothetical protein